MSSSGALVKGTAIVKLSSLDGVDIGLSAAPVVPRRGEGLGIVLSSRDLLLTVELAVGA